MKYQAVYKSSDYLMHHGVKGQKWGVRRYQNDDGTLTAEGRERYGGMTDRGDRGLVKKWTLGSEAGNYAFAKWRERRHKKNLAKAQNQVGRHAKAISDLDSIINSKDPNVRKNYSKEDLKKLQSERDWMQRNDDSKRLVKERKYESKLAAQSAANRNLDAYRRHSSTAKLMIQNLGLFGIGGMAYRHARARGESRLSSLVEAATPVGPILRMTRDKKAYGKYIVFSEPTENEYYADNR